MTEPTTHSTPSTQALQKAVLAMPMARTLGLRFVRAEPGATELETVSYTHLTLPTICSV